MSEQQPKNIPPGFKGHPLIGHQINRDTAGLERCPSCQDRLEWLGGWAYQCRNLACSLGFDKRILVTEEPDMIVHVI
jgi:hypothetical protein